MARFATGRPSSMSEPDEIAGVEWVDRSPGDRSPPEHDSEAGLACFPYGAAVEEAQAARQAAVKLLWDKRSMLPENSEEIVEDVLAAALPFFRFYPLGDNHHNAAMCPYCSKRRA